MKAIIDFTNFDSLDIRVGRIIKVEDAETRKPTYRMTIDFGSEIGIKISCGAYKNYLKEYLVGKHIIGVVNFQPKNMGTEISEVLVLGVSNDAGEVIYLTPESDVPPGVAVF
ncbi:MAG: protein secretion chaperonin CsaA [Candidatus Sungiibacteriota bacterium]